jgi:hypothetical protein
MTTRIADVLQAAGKATAVQASAAAAVRNAAAVGSIAAGVSSPPGPAAVTVAPGTANGHPGG